MRDWEAYVREHLSLPDLRPEREAQVVRELAMQLEDFCRDAMANGFTEPEAVEQAEQQIRDWKSFARDVQRADRWSARNRWRRSESYRLGDLVRDLLFALRGVRRAPSFSLLTVLTLTLGIGATAAVFAVVHAVVLSPLPFDEPNALVAIEHVAPALGIESAGQCAAWHLTYEDENKVFEDIGMFGRRGQPVTITGRGDPETARAVYATSGLFRALRLQPTIGRSFTPDDENVDAPPTVLLSHGYWKSRFGADRRVVGQTLRVDGTVREIVGVMPSSLRSLAIDTAIYLPFRFRRDTLFIGNIGFDAVARLKPGIGLEPASADLRRMLPLAWEKFPGGPVASSSSADDYVPVLQPLKTELVGAVSNELWILFGGVSVVWLIVCANVANLFLVRANGKETEMALRSALGASRDRIRWEYVKESLLLGTLGGAGGFLLGHAGLRVLLAQSPGGIPRLHEVGVTMEVALFTFAISLAAGVFFGALPVWSHRRRGLVDALKQGGSSGLARRDRSGTQDALAVSQVALAFVLLVASGLMLRSFLALRTVEPGFQGEEDVLTLRLRIPPGEIENPAEAARAHELLARRFAELPGVDSVGSASAMPMDGSVNVNPLYVEGTPISREEAPPLRRHKWIGADYFRTLRIPLLVGRSFTWSDIHNRIPGVLVSESLARELWGSAEAAMGKRVSVRPEPVRWHEVIGVAADVREDGMDRDPVLEVYWPQVTLAFWEGSPADEVQTWRNMAYAIRSERSGSEGLLHEVREAVYSVNPNLPLTAVWTLPELMSASMARTAFALVLLGISSLTALLLGVVGVYGVIGYSVSLRGREIGLRVALGASSRDVKRMILKQGLVLSGLGVMIGLALALGFTRLMASLLFAVAVTDPVTYVVMASCLIAVALGATYVPARRAASVDPMDVLRSE